jgi:TatD DNase family protein
MIDSHAHLTDPRFAGEEEEVLRRAREAGVEAVVSIGTTADDSRAAAALAERFPDVFASAGVHPHSAEQATEEAFAAIRELAARPRVVAIGETGLDFFYDNAPRRTQREAFARHLRLGVELDLPVVVHAREADEDTAALLREAGPASRGILHCFSSGAALLETALGLGWYVSFAGMITFARYEAADLLRAVPLDRLLVETDSPYLAPVPFRGKRNEPAYVASVARRAAELRGEDAEELAAATARNARLLYRLPGAEPAAARG